MILIILDQHMLVTYKKIMIYNLLILILSNLIFSLPIYANPEFNKKIVWANIDFNNSFPIHGNSSGFSSNSFGVQLKEIRNNTDAQLRLSLLDHKHLKFDQTYLNYKYRNTIFGIGKINRHWSFSSKNSLILSSNARPSNSIYFNIKKDKKSKVKLFSWAGPWSYEMFNSVLKNQSGPSNSMLLGMRAIINPINNLKFELVKTSQWGGVNKNSSIKSFKNAIIGNTNENKYKEINQLAGFGFSYYTGAKKIPFEIYGQFIGEDEAGGLPSCFMKLMGATLDFKNVDLSTKIGFEYLDTRIDETTHGNCGPNTAYNNGSYKYTNYDVTLGAPIDTESKSIEIWGTTNISQNKSINYSIKKIIINDTNWSSHRLSSNRQEGWLNKLGMSISKGSFKIQSDLSYQDTPFGNSLHGLSLNLNTIYKF